MVGDNLPSDIAGGRAAGMLTIWLDDRNDVPMPPEADLKVASLKELHQLWLAQRQRTLPVFPPFGGTGLTAKLEHRYLRRAAVV